MRTLGVMVAVLVLANSVVLMLRRSLSVERGELVNVVGAQSHAAAGARNQLERERDLAALVAQAREVSAAPPHDIGALRDALIEAEQGLAIERLSLEFRPELQIPSGMGGSRVQASLRGAYEALHQYLERIEALLLPVSPRSLVLRAGDEGSSVALTMQWTALWPLDELELAAEGLELAALERSQLSQWLAREPSAEPGRNLFTFRSADGLAKPAVVVEKPKVPLQALSADPQPERPVLTGFVLARPELEPDVRRRVLVALRYAGEVRLLVVGDTIGAYVVESMEARESVTLEHVETGESIRLALD